MKTRPPIRRNPYNQSLFGVYGEFGSGAGAHAFYLQSAMTPRDLDKISLVSDIPGSEKWPVRALFQREIDTQQVTDRLIPYLRNTRQVRFFNPLTLTLLPMDSRGHTVLPSMPTPRERPVTIDEQEWQSIQREDFYRIRWIEDAPEYAVLEWNDTRSRLVAIDGQHRLFGLKSLWRDKPEVPPGEEFLRWRIPVVVVSFRGGEDTKSPPTVLDTVRSIFVSINTQAQPVNEARRILLSDDSINAVCTQEFIQEAHSNDTEPLDNRDSSRVPLVFFDWRGQEHKRETVRSPAALKSIVEVRDWFRHYLLGDDFTRLQKGVMDIVPTSDLHSAFHAESLTHEQAESVRCWARSDILPALSYLLENFAPYSGYIATLRTLESESLSPNTPHVRRHAFDDLRFGSNRGEDSIQDQVRAEVSAITKSIERAKRTHLDKLVAEDIGMRGVVCAFGHLRDRFHGPPKWTEYAAPFTDCLNRLRNDGWLSLESTAEKRGFLLHVAEDHAGEVSNYRLEQAKNALGALVALLVAAYGMPWPTDWKFSWTALREEQLDRLASPLRRGFRRQVKAELKEKYPDDGTLAHEVDKKADALTQRRVMELRNSVNEIVAERGAA